MEKSSGREGALEGKQTTRPQSALYVAALPSRWLNPDTAGRNNCGRHATLGELLDLEGWGVFRDTTARHGSC